MLMVGDRFKNAWNAFMGRDPTTIVNDEWSYGSSVRPYGTRLSFVNVQSIIGTVYNRIAVDAASININHVRYDEKGIFVETLDSSLNRVLTMSANLDQTGRDFVQDIIMTMFDEGVVAIVPTDTDVNPIYTDSYKIYKARVGKIVEWYPSNVRISVYREDLGKRVELVLPKRVVPIIENPFYTIMNEPNSTSQRLRKILNQIDRTNEQNSSGKMDMIIQLPYSIKSKARKIQAEEKRKELEDQLKGSQYGVGYIDATEKVIQLNRSIENNLWEQARDLTTDLYNQLGLSQSIFDGTADEKILLNYYDRTISPILTAITEEMTRKWISKTAITQGQRIRFFNDPFRLVPVSQMAELADKFKRNEIMTSNEIRAKIGMKPFDDEKADMLLNSNLNHTDEEIQNRSTETKN